MALDKHSKTTDASYIEPRRPPLPPCLQGFGLFDDTGGVWSLLNPAQPFDGVRVAYTGVRCIYSPTNQPCVCSFPSRSRICYARDDARHATLARVWCRLCVAAVAVLAAVVLWLLVFGGVATPPPPLRFLCVRPLLVRPCLCRYTVNVDVACGKAVSAVNVTLPSDPTQCR